MVADKRVFGLDLLRCIAIILVLLTHTILFINPNIYKIPIYTGLFGVEFFFVLSGFLIGTIILKIHYRQQINFHSIKVFWIRRWFRTLPNYYLMFFVYAALIYVSHHINVINQLKYLAYLVFLQNSVTYQPDNFFQVAWSLSIEEWFYLLFPILLWLLTATFKKNKALPFLLTILIFIAGDLALRTYMALSSNNYWDEGFRKLMPMRLDSIAIGVLSAYVKFNYNLLWDNRAKIMAVCGVVLFSLLTVYFSINYVQRYDPVTLDHNFNPGIFLKTLFFTLSSISVALIIPFLSNMKISSGYIIKPVTFISKISYSIYLSHFFIILLLANIFKHLPVFKYENIGLFVCIWIATISISALQYNYFEVKMTAIRSKFSKEQAEIQIQA